MRSFEYIVAETLGVKDLYAKIASSPADLLILGDNAKQPALNKQAADPSGTKLIFGYLSLVEATEWNHPGLFASGALPSWFGNPNTPWPGLYTVQYWNPAWEPELFSTIDRILASGFDGIFLDGLNGDVQWSAGNIWGNPVYADAVSALATLIANVRNYIRDKYPGRTIYLIGNGPYETAIQYPSSTQNLDAIFNEIVFYAFTATSGQASEYIGTHTADYYLRRVAPVYQGANLPILGGDYPTPLTDASAAFLSFDFYSALGWIPTVNNASQTTAKFSTGPFMFMATPSSPTVEGAPCFVNYLSGGVAPKATLIGGQQGNYFIGGPGENTITGGQGNDVIYAHPTYSLYKNKLVFTLSSGRAGAATTPSVTVTVNGRTEVQATPISTVYPTTWQVLTVDFPPQTPVSSLQITVTGASYSDQNNYSNVQIEGVLWNGVAVDLASGTYSNGATQPWGGTYSNNGTVTFPASSFAAASPYLSNNAAAIDGGGGVNTVVYRAPSANYTRSKQPDGSWVVTSATTAEGPDQLTNIQTLKFSDTTLTL